MKILFNNTFELFCLFVFVTWALFLNNNGILYPVHCLKSAGDTYVDTLRGSNFNNEFIDLLSTRDICNTIKNYITREQIKCAISYDVLNISNIINSLEKTLLRDHNIIINGKEDILKKYLNTFLTLYIKRQSEDVNNFIKKFSNSKLDVVINYRYYEEKFLSEYEEIDSLKKGFSNHISEIKDILNNISSSNNYKKKSGVIYFPDVKETLYSKIQILKEILCKLRNKVSFMYNINFALDEFKENFDKQVYNFKGKEGLNDFVRITSDITNPTSTFTNVVDINKFNVNTQMDEIQNGTLSKEHLNDFRRNIINLDVHIRDPSSFCVNQVENPTEMNINNPCNNNDGNNINCKDLVEEDAMLNHFSFLLHHLEKMTCILIFSLKNKISSARDDIQKDINKMESELINVSNEINRLDIVVDVPQHHILNYHNKNENKVFNLMNIKNEYYEYLGGHNKINNNFDDFDNTLMLLERKTNWIKDQNIMTYGDREDIHEAISSTLEMIDKLKDMYVTENFNLLITYENLYKEINLFLYNKQYNISEEAYIYAWNSLENFKGKKLLTEGIDRLLGSVMSISYVIKYVKVANKHLNPQICFNLNKLSNAFMNIEEKLVLYRNQFYRLNHDITTLKLFKNNIEKLGYAYRDNMNKVHINMDTYNIATENLQHEIDNILENISDVLYEDMLINELKTMRATWKNFVYVKYDYFKQNNKLIEEFDENKLIIFPPQFGLMKQSEQTNIRNDNNNNNNNNNNNSNNNNNNNNNNKDNSVASLGSSILTRTSSPDNYLIGQNFIKSPYYNLLYEFATEKINCAKTPEERIKSFGEIYRTIDRVSSVIKENRKNLRSKYDNMRIEILKLIDYRKHTFEETKDVHKELIRLEGFILNTLDNLFAKRMTLSVQMKNSVEMLKGSLYKDKLPDYCKAVEMFIPKYFLTMTRWRNFLLEYRKIMPSRVISKFYST
ncbi:hypothetical protein CYL21_2833 [Plasmodium falciparum NF54]|uniref:Uncharacterized protein PF3D7_1404800 n=2 Tax=Plasmodium falciparum TaxID=5833 RepID=YPF02_PLAF7|nr:conserved Plasmodium protein, unknown function [Plasmodium falciparum 3D7]Q8IM46.2 RecName: Full=Uncharacterized protein PF3D7_1404800; Flags: Precursor [Plasmodium falciparum 3D7]EWC86141.1 hypothetical protein PFNF54_04872 [Plasmodium falciparum NF54]KAF4329639.1 hypothetical protein CYL21_2833 [Plasmodium falciparum NF54]PKC49545.1 hypothetical protein CK202_0253 [Plasmodium falciparum NF54]CZT99755.1 conserved Plasmodium protein, unknown function [Plasmodium falciparum 3D7]|eukprot:XP_001348218.2 conserved Plasmodium protein, unknown function [Plasmodium falciparum 3D7]